jgi:hypothetical protein
MAPRRAAAGTASSLRGPARAAGQKVIALDLDPGGGVLFVQGRCERAWFPQPEDMPDVRSGERSIAILREAISTLEDEIADAEPIVAAAKQSTTIPIIEAAQESKASSEVGEVRMLQPRRWGGIVFEAAWRRVARWWRGRG